jgi:hypothetical protein
MKIKFLGVFLAVCVFCPNVSFSQNFSRILELKTARMNGQDIANLQERLILLGFYNVGEADGYYGPKTEQVIKAIQRFSGFQEDGKVDHLLWNFIFSNDGFSVEYLRLINTVSLYNKDGLYRIGDGVQYKYWNFAGYEYTIFYSSDGKMRILEINGGNGDNAYGKEYYFVDEDKYILIHYRSNVSGESNHGVYLRNGGNSCNINQGKIDHDSSYKSNDSDLLGILYSLRFR